MNSASLRDFAPAKVNLWLHVLGRRADGFHDLDSLVAFADLGDELRFAPGGRLSLVVEGPGAAAAGPLESNLVMKAAHALAARAPTLRLGGFALTKTLPVAAGLGGGSSDAAAALRLLARANGLTADHPALFAAADATGADVRVCLDPRARRMGGRGEIVGPPAALPPLHAVLVNPGIACPTGQVFAALGLLPGQSSSPTARASRGEPAHEASPTLPDISAARNDLEAPAIRLVPAIAQVLDALRATAACAVARMSGSGATCFGLYRLREEAEAAAAAITASGPDWWIEAASLA